MPTIRNAFSTQIMEQSRLKTQLELLRILDRIISSTDDVKRLSIDDLIILFDFAKKTKVPLYFLESLFKSRCDAFFFRNLLNDYRLRYANMLELVKETACLLRSKQIEYAFFKTLRPFPSVGSDIDVLVFDSSLRKILHVFPVTYQVLDMCEDNATIYCPSYDLKVDLHLALSVSFFPYLDVDSLRKEIVENNLEGIVINEFTSEAEVVITACHSVFKEQMLTLQDCYVFQHLLPSCNMDRLLRFLCKNHTTLSFNLSIIIAESIFNVIRGKKPQFQFSDDLGFADDIVKYEVNRVFHSGLCLPYKYSSTSVLLSFAERAFFSSQGQKGALLVARRLFDKAFVARLIDRLPQHFQRLSY